MVVVVGETKWSRGAGGGGGGGGVGDCGSSPTVFDTLYLLNTPATSYGLLLLLLYASVPDLCPVV